MEIVYDGTNFRLISNEKHNPKFTGVLAVTDPAPSILLTNTANTAAPTTARLSVSGNNAVLQVGAANTVTVSANNMTVAGSINTAGLTSSAAISSTGSVTGAGLISTGGIAASGNIGLATGAERTLTLGDAGAYYYGNATGGGSVGLYSPSKGNLWAYQHSTAILNLGGTTLQHNGVDVVTSNGGTWGIHIAGNAGGNAATSNRSGSSQRLHQGGDANATQMTFHWNGQGGQPTWLWGGNDGTNHYVYNPANFSVNYANSANVANYAGNADTVGYVQVNNLLTNFVDGWRVSNEGNPRMYFANGSVTAFRGYGDPIFNFHNGGGSVAARIRAGGTYENLSDRRTKYDIEDANDIGRDNLMALRPRWYKRIGIDRRELGWISQETRDAIDAAVQPLDPNDPDELLYIDEKAISVATVATVQELIVEMEALKAEVAILKADAAQKAA